jgi:hypothetical protein
MFWSAVGDLPCTGSYWSELTPFIAASPMRGELPPPLWYIWVEMLYGSHEVPGSPTPLASEEIV